jgi:hypothetical protein
LDETSKKSDTTTDDYMNFIKSKVHTTKSLPKKSDSPFMKDDSSKKLDIFLNN